MHWIPQIQFLFTSNAQKLTALCLQTGYLVVYGQNVLVLEL